MMGNMLVAMLFLAFSFVSFRFSYGFMGAYRTFYGLFTYEMELFVINIDAQGEATAPYFSLSKVDAFTKSYLNQRLANTCNYIYDVRGYEFRGDEGEAPMGVAISLKCYLMNKTLLDKTAYFTLVEDSE